MTEGGPVSDNKGISLPGMNVSVPPGVLPSPVLAAARVATTALLAAALFGLGTGVRVRVLLATGARAMTLGAISTVAIAAIAYAGILLVAGTA